MVDLFQVTAPLMVRLPDGRKQVVAELFPHPEGLLWFELYWHLGQPGQTIHLMTGPIAGEGPWKEGDHVFHVLGCQGTDAELASAFGAWSAYLQRPDSAYPPAPLIAAIARRLGAAV